MKVIIVEDEPVNARRLKKLIEEIDPNLMVLGVFDTVESTVYWLNQNQEPDLMFLDIQLADGLSFEIFNQVKLNTPVIFTTAFDQFAIQAFKNNGIDYLLKPINKAELASAIAKVNRFSAKKETPQMDLSVLSALLQGQSNELPRRLIVRFGQNIKAIDFSDIAVFYSEDKGVNLLTMKNESFPVDETLEKLEKLLDHSVFFRVNRSSIVNFYAIENMMIYSKSRVKIVLKLPLKYEVIASTEKSGEFKNWLSGRRK